MTKSIFLILTLAFTSLCALAADISGKWTAQVPGRGGEPQETTFTFKVDGGALTGMMVVPQGERPLSEGKVSGDSVSFAVETQRGKMQYTGTVTGDEIKFKREGGQGQAREFVAKRVKAS